MLHLTTIDPAVYSLLQKIFNTEIVKNNIKCDFVHEPATLLEPCC